MMFCALRAALPLLFMLDNGLRADGEILNDPLGLVHVPHFGNIVSAWEGGGLGQSMGRPFSNSLIVTAVSVIAVTALATFAGYALGAYRYRGSAAITQIILTLVAIPTQALIIPVFDMLGNWNLTNNYLGSILVYSAFWLPFSVLLVRATARSFPRELLEAARMDRLNEFAILWRMTLPILRGPIQGVAVVNTTLGTRDHTDAESRDLNGLYASMQTATPPGSASVTETTDADPGGLAVQSAWGHPAPLT